MPFSSLEAFSRRAHPSRVRESPGAYWEKRNWQLRRILQAGRWTIHDIVNRTEVRRAVVAQWRLSRRMQEDLQVQTYINFLEYLEDVSRRVAPAPSDRPSSSYT